MYQFPYSEPPARFLQRRSSCYSIYGHWVVGLVRQTELLTGYSPSQDQTTAPKRAMAWGVAETGSRTVVESGRGLAIIDRSDPISRLTGLTAGSSPKVISFPCLKRTHQQNTIDSEAQAAGLAKLYSSLMDSANKQSALKSRRISHYLHGLVFNSTECSYHSSWSVKEVYRSSIELWLAPTRKSASRPTQTRRQQLA